MTPKLLALFLLAFSGPAFAGHPPRHSPPTIFVFGDSLSDNGNVTTYHPELVGSEYLPPYDPQRMSNGPIWVDYVSKVLNTPVLPEVDGGTNYAVGGASVSPENYLNMAPDVAGFSQVGRFLADHHGRADPEAIYIVWLGGNDIDPPVEYTDWAYGTLVEMVGRLHAAGARTFLIPNLMDMGKLPGMVFFAGEEFAALMSEMTIQWNQRLAGLAASFPAARIRISDVHRLVDEVDAHPAAFGFTNTSDACYRRFVDDAVCPDPDRYWYMDWAHPTTRAHKILASLFVLDLVRSGAIRPAQLVR